MARILITGGAGYIGSVMTPALLAAGHEVAVLDSFLFRQDSLLDCCHDRNFTIVRGDCRDEALLKTLVKKADIMIPLAALVGAPLCQKDPVNARTTNLDAVRVLLKLRSRSQAVLFPNTNSGYGVGEGGAPCTEDSPLKPLTLYGRLKVEAEESVLQEGNAVSFRLATVFGASPRMRTDLLVNDFVHRAVRDRCVVVFEGRFRRNYIHVRDVARAFLHALDNLSIMAGRPYNLGLNDANLTKLELCERIRGHLPEFVFLEAQVGEDPDKRDYVVSNDRLYATGFTPKYSLDDGIRELVKAFTIVQGSSCANA